MIVILEYFCCTWSIQPCDSPDTASSIVACVAVTHTILAWQYIQLYQRDILYEMHPIQSIHVYDIPILHTMRELLSFIPSTTRSGSFGWPSSLYASWNDSIVLNLSNTQFRKQYRLLIFIPLLRHQLHPCGLCIHSCNTQLHMQANRIHFQQSCFWEWCSHHWQALPYQQQRYDCDARAIE